MLLHHRNLECTGRRSLVIDNRKCSTIRTGVIIQSKTTKLKNPYLRKRVQICAISEKPSAGKYCRLNRNPTEKHSVLKSWLSRYWSVRFEIRSLRLVSAEVVLVSFKITKRTMRPDMSYIRCCVFLIR
jgi:hypothetical protein